jgi:hypothetical protein
MKRPGKSKPARGISRAGTAVRRVGPVIGDKRAARRSAASVQAWATRRANKLAGRPAPLECEAGRKQNYAVLQTWALAALLPGEQAYVDRFVGGMQTRFALARLTAIEAELSARGVDGELLTALRFGVAEHDSPAASLAERFGLEQDEAGMLAEAGHFRPDEF